MKTSPNVFKCYLSSPFFLWGLEKATKIFSSPNTFLQWVSNGVQHPRHCPPPTSNCPTMSSNAPSKCPPMSSYAPLQLSTTGVPGSYRRRHRLTLLPLWRAVCRTYMSYIYICPNWITEEYHQQQSTQQFHTPSRWPRRLSIEHPCHQGLQKQPTLDTLDIIGSEVCC